MGEDFVFLFFLLVLLISGGMVLYFIQYCRSATAPAGLVRLLGGNLLVGFFLLALLFVAGESYYRFIFDTTDSLAYTKVSRRWLERYYVPNSAGFRDNIEYSLALQPGRRRISFVGDSFTAGHGVKSVEDRFPNLIRHDHPQWDIHVIAKLGADTGGELAMLKKSLAEGYQIDQVVLVYNLNDVSDIMPEWQASLKRIFADEDKGGWLRRHSYFVDIIYHRLKVASNPEMKNYYGFVRAGYSGPLWDLQKQRLTAFRDLVQAHGGRLTVVNFPFLHDVGPDYEFQFMHDELNRFWSGLGVPHLDLLPVYRDLPPSKLVVNKYDALPNEYAHALAAVAIERFLETNLAAGTRPTIAILDVSSQPH